MKKLVLVLALLTSFNAFAEDNFAHIQYTFRDTIAGDQGNTNRQGINLTFGRNITNNWQVDIGEQFRTEKFNEDKGAGNNTTRLEAGTTYTQPLNNMFSLYTRGAIGYKLTADQDYSYYSVESGANIHVIEPLTLRVGYRYRDSFSQEYFDKTNTVRLGAQYALNKTSFLSAGIDRAYGDSQFLGVNLGYGVRF